MSRWIRIALLLPVLGLLTLTAVTLALQYWVSSADFRGRVEREANLALGVPVQLGAITVDLWPLPALALDRIAVRSQPPLTLERVEARPVWAALLAGRLEIATLIVRQAVLPQQALALIGAAMLKQQASGPRPQARPGGSGSSKQEWWPRQARLEQVSWVDARGRTTTIDARLALADDGLPASASVQVLRGRLAGARLQLQRQAATTAWAVQAEIGGGKVTGPLTLQPAKAAGVFLLQGGLEIRDVEVAALTAPSRTLTGRLDARTTLRAAVTDLGGLADALQTQTRFTVRNGVIQGIDLQQAVQTVGLSRGGNTKLDALAGRLTTQGGAMHLTQLVATAGRLSASGEVTVAASRVMSGRVVVDLAGAGGLIGVPLTVGGTLDSPSVTLSRGALIGAAIGTAVMPGVGTGAGAKLGDRLGQGLRGLFGK